MSKNFYSNVVKFPTGESIAPEGCRILTNVIAGKYGKFRLPISICVENELTHDQIFVRVFEVLAKHYGWKHNDEIIPTTEDGTAIAVQEITCVAGFDLPAPIKYHFEINQNTLVKVEDEKNEAIEKLEEENRKNSIGIYLRFVKQGAISLSEAAKELGIPKSDLELMI